jgi:hypothetical protein
VLKTPTGKSGWAVYIGENNLAQPITVTMTFNNEAVKGCAGLPLFAENLRRLLLRNRASGTSRSRKLKAQEATVFEVKGLGRETASRECAS